MKLSKNDNSIKRLVTYILLIIMRDKLKVSKDYLYTLKKDFQMRPEKEVEIFRKPREVYYNYKNGLGGDCDDYTTLICYIANKLDIPFQIVFLRRNNSVYHVYPELYINKEWTNWDRWPTKTLKEGVTKIIIEPCLYTSVDGKKNKFCLRGGH